MATVGKVISQSPENRETPLADTQGWVTPNKWFFVRSHFDTPEVDVDAWRLSIGGCVKREVEISYSQLMSMKQHSVFSTMECAGNGRSFLEPKVEGVQWTAGAVGHAEWSGVPLKAVLTQADLNPEAIELVFHGGDRGVEKGSPDAISFSRALPFEKAFDDDTLLATHMNGEPLEPSHGFPVRLIVPGWYGVASVKWLERIEAVAEPFTGYFQSVKYTIQRNTGRGTNVESVGPMPIKSEMIRPSDKDVVGVGTNRICGLAWAGASAIKAVEVSIDGGATWHTAELYGPRAPYSWTMWEYAWQVTTPGEYQLLSRAISSSGEVQPTQHDTLRGGYLINFSRATHVTVDASQRSDDALGDAAALRDELAAATQSRLDLPLDADMELLSGAGI